MMNKMNMAILTSLIFCGVNSTFSMGLEQREILYTLNDLGQNLADVPMVVQNVDMFMGIIAMNIQLNEAKFNVADSKFKKALGKNAALIGGMILVKNFAAMGLDRLRSGYTSSISDKICLMQNIRLIVIDGFILNDLLGLSTVVNVFAALNIYDAYKNRSALTGALALDRAILAQLEEIKGYVDHNDQPAGNFLLETAAQS